MTTPEYVFVGAGLLCGIAIYTVSRMAAWRSRPFWSALFAFYALALLLPGAYSVLVSELSSTADHLIHQLLSSVGNAMMGLRITASVDKRQGR